MLLAAISPVENRDRHSQKRPVTKVHDRFLDRDCASEEGEIDFQIFEVLFLENGSGFVLCEPLEIRVFCPIYLSVDGPVRINLK